jgi:hypothetical protein
LHEAHGTSRRHHLVSTRPTRAPARKQVSWTWARVTIGQFRHLALRTFYGHMVFTNILPAVARIAGSSDVWFPSPAKACGISNGGPGSLHLLTPLWAV